MTVGYKRGPDELRQRACLYWPRELAGGNAATVLSELLKTQDKFLSILLVADREPTSWKAVLSSSSLSPNLFLKHLTILADVGGELIKKITPLGSEMMHFQWREKEWHYSFKCAHIMKLDNHSLHISTDRVRREVSLHGAMEDVVMLLLFGGASKNIILPEEISDRCNIGLLLGDKHELEQFIKPRYILVSRIVRGATANSLGQEAQKHVLKKLKQSLDKEGWEFSRNGTIAGISQTADTREISFDIVAKSPENKYFAIEVSFQVTTNSTIERKAGQAKSRYEQLHEKGHKIAYVIDGAGNFERKTALRTICDYSDCTVTFAEEDLDTLVDFLRTNGGATGGSLQ